MAGVQIVMGTGEGMFSPLELLLAAIAGCTSVDVDALASRRSEPDEFVVRASAHKVKDEAGRNVLADIKLEFTVTFPEGEAGDKARAILPVALKASHDLSGQTLNIFGPWRGEDQALVDSVLAYFSAASGVKVNYSSSEGYEQQIMVDTQAGSPLHL